MIAPANRITAQRVLPSGMRRTALLIGACLALAGCGGGGYGGGGGNASGTTTTTAGAAGKTVQISEKEYSLTPSTVNIAQPGTVSFKVTNDGQIAHALKVEGNGVEQETDTLQPGDTTTLTVQLAKAGSYEMYCPVDGHEGKGMKGTVSVGGSAGSGGMTTTDDTTTDKGPGY
jgi:uncharacterized cupredoxin-like copper-binding protein